MKAWDKVGLFGGAAEIGGKLPDHSFCEEEKQRKNRENTIRRMKTTIIPEVAEEQATENWK